MQKKSDEKHTKELVFYKEREKIAKKEKDNAFQNRFYNNFVHLFLSGFYSMIVGLFAGTA
jgi:hypothetical protein